MYRLVRCFLKNKELFGGLNSLRTFSTPQMTNRLCSTSKKDRVVHFICGDQTFTGKGKLGDSLLDVVVDNDLPLDGYGACEGTLACCTCHVILEKEHFDRVDKVNPAGEEELDMLDLAPDLCDYSRLGCQIRIEKEDGPEITVRVPMIRRDARQGD